MFACNCCWTHRALNPLFGFLAVCSNFSGKHFHWRQFIMSSLSFDSTRLDATRFNVNFVYIFAIHLLKASNQRKHCTLCLEIFEQNMLWPHTHALTCAGEFIAQAFHIYENIWKIQPHSQKLFVSSLIKGCIQYWFGSYVFVFLVRWRWSTS